LIRVRSIAKWGAEAVLARSGAARLLGSRSGALVLAYHNVVPEGSPSEGDASLHLPQRAFAEQLDILVRTHDVVPLDTLVERGAQGSGRPRAAVTFDDAYRGAVTAGVAELAKRGLPATIFVAPAFVGGRSFWWDAVSPAQDGAAFRARALEELRGDDSRVRARARERGIPVVMPHPDNRAADEAELRAAVGNHGITLGSHTWSHLNLARTDGATLSEELVRPLEWLRERFAAVIPWLAYPYGLSSPAVARAAANAGYDGALRVTGGWVPDTPSSAFALPRLNVPAGLSADGFRLRMQGLLCR
jgi:peptidoglycan/xylan/chitin deacetylase (PgdA/CDA1 family)